MRVSAIIFLCFMSLLTSVQSSYAFRAPFTQFAQAQIGDFDGEWVGSGQIARPIFKSRCGNGPLINLKIENGTAEAVFKAFAKGKAKTGLKTRVVFLRGRIDSDGQLELSGQDSAAKAVLLASNGSGEGTWEFRNLVCEGIFRVRRKP